MAKQEKITKTLKSGNGFWDAQKSTPVNKISDIKIIREVESDIKEIKKKKEEDEGEANEDESDALNEFIPSSSPSRNSNSRDVTPTLQVSSQTQDAPDLESTLASTPSKARNESNNTPEYSATSYEAKYSADYTETKYSQETQMVNQIQMQRARDENITARTSIPTELRDIRQSTQALPDNQMRASQQTETRNLGDYTSKIETEERKRLPFERRRRTI